MAQVSKTICNLVLQSKISFFFLHKLELFSMSELAQRCSQACLITSTSLLLTDVFRGTTKDMEGKSHYSAYLLNSFQNDTNPFRTSFSLISASSFKHDFHSTFTQFQLSPHTIYVLHRFLLSVSLCIIGAVFSRTAVPQAFADNGDLHVFNQTSSPPRVFEPLLRVHSKVQFSLAKSQNKAALTQNEPDT